MVVKIVDCPLQQYGIVLEPPKSSVAVEAKEPSHDGGAVAVVDVLGGLDPAHGTVAALRFEQPSNVLLTDPVAVLKQPVANTAVPAFH